MKKNEFIDELRYALEGKLPPEDLNEITADYADIFENGIASGKSEERIAEEIGSPAKVARTILEDGPQGERGGDARGSGSREPEKSGAGEAASQVWKQVSEEPAASGAEAKAAANQEPPSGSNGPQGSPFKDQVKKGAKWSWAWVSNPNPKVDPGELATMPRRLGAFVIDAVIGAVILGLLAMLIGIPMYLSFKNSPMIYERQSVYEIHNSYGSDQVALHNGYHDGHYYDDDWDDYEWDDDHDWDDMFEHMGPGRFYGFRGHGLGLLLGTFALFLLCMGVVNFFTMLFTWATHGYTPGKWLLHIRVVRIDGQRIGFLEAFLREFVVKCLINNALGSVPNLVSFIWGSLTPDHKTIQDLLAQTKVVNTKLVSTRLGASLPSAAGTENAWPEDQEPQQSTMETGEMR